jgi:hypothetical protein
MQFHLRSYKFWTIVDFDWNAFNENTKRTNRVYFAIYLFKLAHRATLKFIKLFDGFVLPADMRRVSFSNI